MKELNLTRDKWSHMEVMGVLTFGDETLQTIERPWVPTEPGGKPYQSCIPAGRYNLRFHDHHGKKVVALVNPGHAVFYRDEDRDGGVGRFMILIHVGNWVDDVVGCIAPGNARATSGDGRPMVTSSKDSMKMIMEYIGDDDAQIIIDWINGEPE